MQGKVLYKLGDHIDTDLISPSKYMTSFDTEYLATICFKDVYPDFREKMEKGGILIGGINFGCGSSRETAPIALKMAGVKAIIAEEFARIFYRNAINIGLPCIVCKNITKYVSINDEMEIDFRSGEVKNISTGKVLKGTPIPEELHGYFEAGGLMECLKKQIKRTD